jgi:hypothetical protein
MFCRAGVGSPIFLTQPCHPGSGVAQRIICDGDPLWFILIPPIEPGAIALQVIPQ